MHCHFNGFARFHTTGHIPSRDDVSDDIGWVDFLERETFSVQERKQILFFKYPKNASNKCTVCTKLQKKLQEYEIARINEISYVCVCVFEVT